MNPTTDFSLIEADKENIQPIKQGRSVAKIAELGSMSTTDKAKKLDLEKAQFEDSLKPERLADLDDPLEPYLDYFRWIRESYPTGNNNSVLVSLLERATHDFKDDEYYKNEVRYFKVWLEYINFSDTPREVFQYLHKKRIGSKLSLFYEQYALFLERQGEWSTADGIYLKGLQCQARPLQKLERAYERFQERRDAHNSRNSLPGPGVGLKNREEGGLGIKLQSKKRQFAVFADDAPAPSTSESASMSAPPTRDSLDSLKNTKKENVIHAVPFQGQTIPQAQNAQHAPTTSRKFEVFSDELVPKYPVTKVVEAPGKRTQRFDFNMDLFIADDGREVRSLYEVLSLMQKSNAANKKKRPVSSDFAKPHKLHAKKKAKRSSLRNSDSFIAAPLEDNTKRLTQSPTLSFFSRQASTQVQQMFNDPASTTANTDADLSGGGTQFNGFSDFVTETLTKTTPKREAEPSEEPQASAKPNKLASECMKTPLKSRDDGETIMSSPFMDTPLRISFHKPTEVNPYKEDVINTTKALASEQQNFHVLSQQLNKLSALNSLFENGKAPVMGNTQSLLRFDNELYCVTKKLAGDDLFLCEKDTGEKYTLHVSNDCSQEFWMMHRVATMTDLIPQPAACFNYSDESYLFSKYYKQGSLSNLLHLVEESSFQISEQVAAYFTVQLIRALNKIHGSGIIHTNVSKETCMVSIDHSVEKGALGYNDLTLSNWSSAIDLSLYDAGVIFKTPEDKKAWKFNRDWHKLAGLVHLLVFGEPLMDGKPSVNPLWDTKWQDLFEELLHTEEPTLSTDIMPIICDEGLLMNQLERMNDLLTAKRR